MGYDAGREVLYFDRRASGTRRFTRDFRCGRKRAWLPMSWGELVIDHSTVEVFGNNGAVYLSGLTFPAAGAEAIILRLVAGGSGIEGLAVVTFLGSGAA